MPAPDISVIICAYTEKRWEEMLAAIESIQRQSLPASEIILVIDHNPQLFERCKTHLPAITIIQNSEDQGLSGARNSAIAIAQGAILAFMDEDAMAAPDWLELLYAAYTDETILGSGGSIHPMWIEGRPAWFPEEFDWVVGCTYRGMPEVISPVRNLIGCNMSYLREVFTEIGGFRSGIGRVGTLPVGCEETELCIRAAQNHTWAKFMYVPAAQVNHRVPGSRSNFKYFSSRCYSEGISKALIAQFVGSRDSLHSEWTYTLKTLPRGFFKGLGDAFLRRDLAGIGRAGAILCGLMLTTLGYVKGKLSLRFKNLRKNTSSREALREKPAV